MTYYPEAEILPSALLEIIEDTMHLYDKMFNTSLGKQVKKIIQEEVLFKGKTGYNLKKDHKNRIPDFSSKLGSETLVDSKTEIGQWYQFFNREYPAQKINWIGTYNQLWYFIKEYSRSDFIKKHLH